MLIFTFPDPEISLAIFRINASWNYNSYQMTTDKEFV